MRAAVLDRVGLEVPDHVGLGYDRWAPLDATSGKIPDDRRREWLRDLAGTRVSAHYSHAYQRWVESLKAEGAQLAEIEMAGRLLVGHGNPSPTAVGLTVHHTWGVPLIPGSALKGLLNHYVDSVYGPVETGMHPMDPAFPAEERARSPFRGVTWNGGRVEHGPGEIHRALFGAPAAKSDAYFEEVGAGETAGLVVFQDALFIPGSVSDRPFAADVLTVHQKAFYDSKGDNNPNDYGDPNPVSFLTVKPHARFLIALSGPEEWARLAFALLRDALVEWGVGGKTTSGYGHIRPDGWNVVPVDGEAAGGADAGDHPTAPATVGHSAIVEEFREWLSGCPAPNHRETLDLARKFWLPRLQGSTEADKREIGRILRREIKKGNAVALRDALIKDLDGLRRAEDLA